MNILSSERIQDDTPIEKPPNALRAFRRFVNKTLQEIADAIGCQYQNLWKAERTGKGLDVEYWCSLSDYYGVPVQVLRNPASNPADFLPKILS